MKDFIFGIRPVIEALQAATSLDTIYVKKDLGSELTGELLEAARQAGVPVKRVPVERLNRLTRKNHQGVVATVAAVTYYKVEQVVPMLYDNGENPLLVVLDGVTDVRNFGALARTADCAGVSALVIPERDSVSVNADAVKTSAGALNYVPVCRERNLVKALRFLRDSGVKIVGTGGQGALPHTEVDLTCPVAIVLGAEDRGVSDEVLALCHERVTIPEFGHINSLNVSVAGGILMYEAVRQRLADGQAAPSPHN